MKVSRVTSLFTPKNKTLTGLLFHWLAEFCYHFCLCCRFQNLLFYLFLTFHLLVHSFVATSGAYPDTFQMRWKFLLVSSFTERSLCSPFHTHTQPSSVQDEKNKFFLCTQPGPLKLLIFFHSASLPNNSSL